MPAKKKHNKGTFQSKQRRLERRGPEPAAGQAKPAGMTVQAAPAAVTPVAQAAAPRPAAAPRVVPAKFNYPNITRELRSIAILFAVVMVAMVVFAMLLR